MRTSCNVCRVLRKGCSDDCSLRPCLHWMKSSESQANATHFLARFYGRTGLLNFINAGPQHLRPAIFRSLLYEACGRIINPVYGSVGLLCSSNWHRCQAAVDAVLNGLPIIRVPSDDAADSAAAEPIMPFKSCDIRHFSKNSTDLAHQLQTRTRFKRSGGRRRGKSKRKSHFVSVVELAAEPPRFLITGWSGEELKGDPSHDSSAFSVETVEASLANCAATNRVWKYESRADDDGSEVVLELSLGLNTVLRPPPTYCGGPESDQRL